ncbi:MAG: HD domain-containing protein [Kyrpidia tusciae]|nr:HD domain-containing protein [Kyrpidia tusciae]MBE3552283.1 HD domain-containing protein [Kyrpidia tusciae]
MEQAKEKVLKDPVHNYIRVRDPLIWRLINTRVFQRLRRIRQLGTSFLTFHGAEHSRFTHSLGAYETMRKVVEHFMRNYGWTPGERTRLLALAAALLHDIGHGPFSHAVEPVTGQRHEGWTVRLLREEAELRAVLDDVDERFAEDVAGVIAGETDFPLLHRLITGQLDVDRMDYLLRDALYTGVAYGQFELERLIRVMIPGRAEVLVRPSGRLTVEQYMLARYFMYAQVYLHPTTVGSDLLVRKIVERAKMLRREGVLKDVPPLWDSWMSGLEDPGELSIEAFLGMDDAVFLAGLPGWERSGDPILSDLAGRLLHRRLFESVPVAGWTPEVERLVREAFAQAGLDPDSYAGFVDVSIDGSGDREPVWLSDGGGKWVNFFEQSVLLRDLPPIAVKRLYFPADLVESGGGRAASLRKLLASLSHEG